MKRTIKRIALIVGLTGALVAGIGATAFAGGPHHGKGFGGAKMFKKLDGMSDQERLEYLEDRLDRRMARMTDHLELTDDQQVKVRQIVADAQTQMLEIYEKNKNVDDKTVARGEAKAVMKQARQDVGDILTDEQKAKIKAKRAEHRKQRKARMIEHLDRKLELSDSQRTKVEKILDDTHAKMRTLRKSAKDEEKARAEAKALMKGAADQIDGVLDAEQKTEWAQMRERFQERAGEGGHKRGKHHKRGKRGEGMKRGAF